MLAKGMAFLPIDLVEPTWRLWLRRMPRTDNGITRHKFMQLRDYFEVRFIVLVSALDRKWLSQSDLGDQIG